MDSPSTDRPVPARPIAGVLFVIGALVTGVFGWLGSIATLVAHPPLEAAVFIAAAALAFGLPALSVLRR